MLRKLFALVSHSCAVDNPDSPQHQEVLLPGTLYGMIIKEKLEEALTNITRAIATDVTRGEIVPDFFDSAYLLLCSLLVIKWCLRTLLQEGPLSYKLRHWIENGKLPSHRKLDFSLRVGSSTGIWFHHRR